MKDNKDWKERFDDKFKGNFPFEHWLYRDGNQKLDREIKLFIDQIILEKDKEWIDEIEKLHIHYLYNHPYINKEQVLSILQTLNK